MLFCEADVRVNQNKQKITSQQLHIDAMADSPLQGNSGRLVLGCIGANFGVAGCDTQFAFRPEPAKRQSVFILRVAGCDTQFPFRPEPRYKLYTFSITPPGVGRFAFCVSMGGQFRQNGGHNCYKRLGDFLLRNKFGTTARSFYLWNHLDLTV